MHTEATEAAQDAIDIDTSMDLKNEEFGNIVYQEAWQIRLEVYEDRATEFYKVLREELPDKVGEKFMTYLDGVGWPLPTKTEESK